MIPHQHAEKKIWLILKRVLTKIMRASNSSSHSNNNNKSRVAGPCCLRSALRRATSLGKSQHGMGLKAIIAMKG